jgi:hypothetical protein
MIKPNKKIREVLFSIIPASYRIKQVPMSTELSDRKLFVETIKVLKKIEDRKDFMLSEIGMDVTAYEDMFFRVIENLFKIAFSKQQTQLIQDYLYDLSPDREWDGYVKIKIDNKEERMFDIKTPEKLWSVLKNFS